MLRFLSCTTHDEKITVTVLVNREDAYRLVTLDVTMGQRWFDSGHRIRTAFCMVVFCFL